MKVTAVASIAATALLFTAIPARSETESLNTQTAGNIGLFVSSYQYREPGIMSLKGTKTGLDLSATKAWPIKLFIRGDLRIASGNVDYQSNGTGSARGNPDRYFEVRGLVGMDRVFEESSLSPYTGFGYRYLYDDIRGASSSGAVGYRRESNYYYLPIGLVYRKAFNDRSSLMGTLEYDQLLLGQQVSKLSDTGLGYSDVTNDQHDGYGLKFSLKYQAAAWTVGPYLYYWDIAQSNTAILYQYGSPIGYGWEPANNTIETGMMAVWQF